MVLWEIYENQYFRGFHLKSTFFIKPPQEKGGSPLKSKHQLVLWFWVV